MLFSRKKIIGIDLKSDHASAVLVELDARHNTLVVLDYATLAITDPEQTLEETLGRLLGKMRSRCRQCALAMWPEGARLKFFTRDGSNSVDPSRKSIGFEPGSIFEGATLENYVFDFDRCEAFKNVEGDSFFIGSGIPSSAAEAAEIAFSTLGYKLQLFQLTPIALFNAFVQSHEEVARNEPYLLADIGRSQSSIICGFKKHPPIMRTIDVGWGDVPARFLDESPDADATQPMPWSPAHESDLQMADTFASEPSSGIPEELRLLFTKDELESESLNLKIKKIANELLLSRNFLHVQDESCRLAKIHLSGQLSSQSLAARTLAKSIDLPCVNWNPFRGAVATTKTLKNFNFLTESFKLSSAAGAAFQVLI